MGAPHRAFEFLYLISEIIVIVLYLTCTEYSTATEGADFFKNLEVESPADIWAGHLQTVKDNIPFNCHATRQVNPFLDCAEQVPSSLSDDDSLTSKKILDTFKIETLKCTQAHGNGGECGIFWMTYISTMQDDEVSNEQRAKEEVQTYYPLF